MKRKTKMLVWIGGGILLLGALGTAGWIWRFRTYTPAAVAVDIRAAIGARNAPQPAVRFLELRYGPLTEPANRQKAFLEFFNLDHQEGLYWIVDHMAGAQKQTNIAATAQWIADYRTQMTPEEKENLRAYVTSEAGRKTLQQATAHYLEKDVGYRSATAPVIKELVSTLAAVKKP
ncbi:MAG: hypothetical protein NTW03_12895 [Verrucomicrobia bacterium]|nr:hypothetical protein [Verrucomicrobiota bacterium]